MNTNTTTSSFPTIPNQPLVTIAVIPADDQILVIALLATISFLLLLLVVVPDDILHTNTTLTHQHHTYTTNSSCSDTRHRAFSIDCISASPAGNRRALLSLPIPAGAELLI
ncbi:hypothetical protein ACFE04_009642 [Oxalis oulophora]